MTAAAAMAGRTGQKVLPASARPAMIAVRAPIAARDPTVVRSPIAVRNPTVVRGPTAGPIAAATVRAVRAMSAPRSAPRSGV